MKNRVGLRRGGIPVKPWGVEPQRDLDTIMHWRLDVQRTLERLADLDEALVAVEQEMRAEREYVDMIESAWLITKQAYSKIQSLRHGMQLRVLRQLENQL